MNNDNDLARFFAQWPETAHLGARVPSVSFETPDGTLVNDGIDAERTVAAFEEFLVIVDTHQDLPAAMVEAADRVSKMLPTLRAFVADPYIVMNSGVN